MKRIVLLTLTVTLVFMTTAFADEQPEPDLAADAQQSTGNPPVIPHAVKPNQDGEECNSCHRNGLNNAPPTSHAERLNCTSCHVLGEVKKAKKPAVKGKKK
jgi:cytochrome c-type protein NapB